MKRFSLVTVSGAIVLAAVMMIFGRSPSASAMQSGQIPSAINDPNLIFPDVRIIRFDTHVARLDTETGEISRFSGTLSGSSANGIWLRLVRPVSGSTSGFLDVKHVGGGTFLIDLATGQTWILRRGSGNSIGTWVRVQKP